MGAHAPSGGSQPVLVAATHLTAAMLLDIFNTPVEVVPPPGPTSVLNLLSAVAVLHAGATPYTYEGDGLVVEARQVATFASNLLTSAEDKYGIVPFAKAGTEVANDLDAPATVYSDSGAPTDGDGTLDVFVYYTIIDTTPLP